jgi:hypothetical protein
MEDIPLEPEQEQLFEQIVEAARSVPREQREPFMCIPAMQLTQVQGNGLLREVLEEDLLVLDRAGLIEISKYHTTGSGFNFFVPPDGYAYYEHLKRRSGEATRQVEQDIQHYLDAESFRAAYPDAYARWKEAADHLWSADSERELSTIGHKCREAIQEFATALVEKYQPPDVNPDKAKTRDRLSAVINLRRPDLGEARSELLDGLFDYWRAADKLIQRQEHAGQREGEPLTGEDGRRVVFQTAVVMFEVDRSL